MIHINIDLTLGDVLDIYIIYIDDDIGHVSLLAAKCQSVVNFIEFCFSLFICCCLEAKFVLSAVWC